LFSFTGSYFILPRCGVYGTLMLIIPCAFACASLKLKWWMKLMFFAGFGYVISAIYAVGTVKGALTGVICGVLIILAMTAIWLFKQKKLGYTILAIAMIAVAITFHIIAMGNPINAFRSDNNIKNYVEERYDSASIKLSSTYYNRSKGIFCADIYGVTDPTVIYTIYAYGDTVADNYDKYVEYSLMSAERLNITMSLREVYPSANFTVVQESISAYPEGKMSADEATDYASRMSFGIYIPSDVTYEEFKSLAYSYLTTLCKTDIKAQKLTFYSGKVGKYYRSASFYTSEIPQNFVSLFIKSNLTEEYVSRSVFAAEAY
jgi:hypothetical protein